MIKQAILITFLLTTSVNAQSLTGDVTLSTRSWHLLTQSYSGTVSLIKDLTEHECEFARDRVLGHPATDEEKHAVTERARQVLERQEAWKLEHNCRDGIWTSGPSFVYKDGICVYGSEFTESTARTVSPGDITSAECFR